MSNPALDYITQAKAILDRIQFIQMDVIESAAELCAQVIIFEIDEFADQSPSTASILRF
jgi:hypothetical protein